MALIPALILLLLWVLGVPVRYLAFLFVAALVIDAVTSGRRVRVRGYSIAPLVLLIVGWSLTIFGVEVVRFLIADQGVDFAIFTQAMGEYASRGEFRTSLVSTAWVDFLTHHFSPLLIVPGGVAALGLNVQIVAIGFHAAALGFALWGIMRLGQQRQLSLPIIAISIGALIMHPGLRIPALWEVHDEVYAAPFVIFGMLFIERGRVAAALLCLALASLCKETMLIVGAVSCFGAIVGDRTGRESAARYRAGQVYALGAAGGTFLVLFAMYSWVLPSWLFTPSFSAVDRVASTTQLIDPSIIAGKLWCVFTWFVFPAVLLVSVCRAGIALRLPRAGGAALAALGYQLALLAITNFDAMWNPYTYYQIMPVMLIGVLFISIVPQVTRLRPTLVAAPLCLSFCFGAAHGPLGPLLQVHEITRSIAEVDQALPKASVVVASDVDTAWLVGSRQVVRAFHANRSAVRFDYIVLRKGRRESLSEHLRSGSRPCFENQIYKVRCARPSFAVDPERVRNFMTSRLRLAQLPLPARS